MVTKSWQKNASGKWLYYGSDGKALKGGKKTIGDATYYFDSNGYQGTGWKTIGGKKYYFAKKAGKDGKMLTGKRTIDGKTYFFNDNGAMVTGMKTISGYTYYFNDDGTMKTGWLTLNGKKYYLYEKKSTVGYPTTIFNDFDYADTKIPAGAMVKGKFCDINGLHYIFKEDGVMAKGPVMKNTKVYYCDPNDGHMIYGDYTFTFYYNGIIYAYFYQGTYLPEDTIYSLGDFLSGSDIPTL